MSISLYFNVALHKGHSILVAIFTAKLNMYLCVGADILSALLMKSLTFWCVHKIIKTILEINIGHSLASKQKPDLLVLSFVGYLSLYS